MMQKKEKYTNRNRLKAALPKVKEGKKVLAAGGVLAAAAMTAAIVGVLFWGKDKNPKQEWQNAEEMMEAAGAVVTASGTTSLGFIMDEFETDYIESEIIVEEVYLSSGEEVREGTPVFRISDENVEEIRAELEEKKTESTLAYRAGVITCEQSRINAEYSLNTALLEGRQAEEVYQSALKRAEDKLETAKEKVADAEEMIEKYSNPYASYYYEYNIDEYKERAEKNSQYYNQFLAEYGFSENGGGNTEAAGAGSSKKDEPLKNTSDKDDKGKEDSHKEEEEEKEEAEKDTKEEDTEKDTEKEAEEDVDKDTGGENTQDPEESGGENVNEERNNAADQLLLSLFMDDNKILSKLTVNRSISNGIAFTAVSEQKQQEEEYNRKSSIIQQMKKNKEESQSYLDKAWSDYEAAAQQADTQVRKLTVQLESLKADLEEAETQYQLEILEAETAYKKSLAQSKLAQSDYDAAIQKAEDELESLQEEMEEAEENLEEFETFLGEGIFYTQNAGTIMMVGVRENTKLQGEGMIVAYRNAEDISVTVAVSQEDINKLEVGDKAKVMVEDYGTFDGRITYLNPIADSDSRTNITYEVIVDLEGDDVSSLKENLTAAVFFGMDAQ